ncbi:MAG: hypothetical protein ACI8RZ_000831 [Myxococcota bacterium]|jgi:hypothetical protein
MPAARRSLSDLTPHLLLLAGLSAASAALGADAQREPPSEPVEAESQCVDGIVGTWVGLERRPTGMLNYTLTIQRINPYSPALIGTIESHFWSGTANQPPTSCGPDDVGYVMHQPAAGTFLAPRVEFSASRIDRVEKRCGEPPTYWPDGFTGQVTADGSAFRTISDDGHTDAQSVTLRRVSCLED